LTDPKNFKWIVTTIILTIIICLLSCFGIYKYKVEYLAYKMTEKYKGEVKRF